MKTDGLFYKLFQENPELPLALAGWPELSSGAYRFVSQEVKQTGFRLDGLLEPPHGQANAPLVFVEVQFQPDEGFYLRFLSEILLYLRQYRPNRDWRWLVLYPNRGVERCQIESAVLAQLPNLCRIYLDELPLADSDNPKLWLIGLILAEGPQLPPLVGRINGYRQQRPGDMLDWLGWLETILIYKFPQLSREELLDMFNINEVELKKTRFYQQVHNEGLLEGKREGRREGRQEGRLEGLREGMQQGERALLSRMLQRRFGPLPEPVRQRLDSADADTLLLWGERALAAQTLEDLFSNDQDV